MTVPRGISLKMPVGVGAAATASYQQDVITLLRSILFTALLGPP